MVKRALSKLTLVLTTSFLSVTIVNALASPRFPPLASDDQQQLDPNHYRVSTSDYGAQKNHPTTYDDDPVFKGPLHLSDKGSPDMHRTRIRRYFRDEESAIDIQSDIDPQVLKPSASTKTILFAVMKHLVQKDAPVDAKECAESFEFYLRTGKRLVGAAKRIAKSSSKTEFSGDSYSQTKDCTIVVHDLCAGHGLTGLIFAACNPPRSNSQNVLIKVKMVDQFEPPSHKILRDYICEVCPWVNDDTVQFAPSTLEQYFNRNENDVKKCNDGADASIVISTHACGSLTDAVLGYAIDSRASSIAVMPCCYTGTGKGVPYGIQRALGVAWSADIRRSFTLQNNQYHCDFSAIPRSITPMNRIIVGERRH